MNKNSLAVFEDYKIRRIYDEESEPWYFSVVDIIQVLIQQPDYQTARKYWNKLKERLKKEGSQSVTKCNRLKLESADGKGVVRSPFFRDNCKMGVTIYEATHKKYLSVQKEGKSNV